MTQSSLEDATHQVITSMIQSDDVSTTLSGGDVASLLCDMVCYARCEWADLPPELQELRTRAKKLPNMIIDKQEMINLLLRVAS